MARQEEDRLSIIYVCGRPPFPIFNANLLSIMKVENNDLQLMKVPEEIRSQVCRRYTLYAVC